MKRKLFLFDIDGTLMSSPNFLEEYQIYLGQQFSQYFGKQIKIDFSGLHGGTERKNLKILLKRQGMEELSENEMDKVFEIAGKNYTASQKNLILLPNVLGTVRILAESNKLGVVTGNQEIVARKKLHYSGLDEYLKFGSFGNESEDRSKLVELALERGRFFGFKGGLNDVYVVGDTPTDIESGKSMGTKTVAVSTGSYSREKLAESNPDYLLSDISELLNLGE